MSWFGGVGWVVSDNETCWRCIVKLVIVMVFCDASRLLDEVPLGNLCHDVKVSVKRGRQYVFFLDFQVASDC
jgi:hypothetical protein